MIVPENFLPPPTLRHYIANYGIIEISEGVVEPYFSPPLALSGFIIQTLIPSTKIVSKIEGEDFFTENAVATGQVTKPVYGQITGPSKCIMVFFHPLGMHQLFDNDMEKLTNKSLPLTAFLGQEQAEQLLSPIRNNQNSLHQIEVLNQFFLSLLNNKKKRPRLHAILDYIHQKKGEITVAELDEYGNYQRKTIERHFKKMVGLTPKVYIQVYQFKCLINLLQARPDITWAQLANEAGYYDQPHMSKYVKEYLKVSPNSIVNLDMDFINYLLNR